MMLYQHSFALRVWLTAVFTVLYFGWRLRFQCSALEARSKVGKKAGSVCIAVLQSGMHLQTVATSTSTIDSTSTRTCASVGTSSGSSKS